MPNLSIIHREIQECTLDYTLIHIAVLLSRPNNGSHAFAVDFCHGTKWQIKFEKWFLPTYKRSEKKCFRYRKDVVQPLISLWRYDLNAQWGIFRSLISASLVVV